MSTQTEQALALVFQRFRQAEVAENELVKMMSLTLNWTKPSKATHLLDRGVNAGLLDREEGLYTARFDPSDVEVPFGFEPEEGLFEPVETADRPASGQDEEEADAVTREPAEGASEPADAVTEEDQAPAEEPAPPEPTVSPTDRAQLDALLDRIAERLEEGDRKRAVAAVNAKQEAMGSMVTLEVAALLVAREMGLDVTEEAEDVLASLKRA